MFALTLSLALAAPLPPDRLPDLVPTDWAKAVPWCKTGGVWYDGKTPMRAAVWHVCGLNNMTSVWETFPVPVCDDPTCGECRDKVYRWDTTPRRLPIRP